MKNYFYLLFFIVGTVFTSCQKKSENSITPVVNNSNNSNSVLSLTDSTKLALYNTTFTIVCDYLFQPTNYGNVDSIYPYICLGYRRMYDTWKIDAVGSCTVVPYTYDCHASYHYSSSNFPFTLHQYSGPSTFTINIHGDTIDMPFNTPIDWDRLTPSHSNFSINQLKYKKVDTTGTGSRCFISLPMTGFPNVFNTYPIK